MLWFLLDCKTFKETVEEVAETRGKKAESKDATDAAGLIEKLSVEDSKKEEVPVAAKEVSKTTDDKVKAEVEKKDEPASSA
jgi:Ran-binding protein 1